MLVPHLKGQDSRSAHTKGHDSLSMRVMLGRGDSPELQSRTLAPSTAAIRTRGHRCGLQLLQVLQHLQHGLARICVGFVVDGTSHGHPQLCTELGFDETVSTQCLFGIVCAEICFTASCRNPYRGERRGPSPWGRLRELFHRSAQPLPDNRNGWQCDKTIIVVFLPT